MKVYAKVTKVNQDVVREENQVVVRGYADITLDDCCKLSGIRIVEGRNGQMFAGYPQKPLYANGAPKLDENGKQVYIDIYHAVKKREDGSYGYDRELNDAIKNLVVEAYKSPEGYAYLNPEKGERSVSYIEPNLHACNGERTKAAGKLLVAGCVEVRDVFVNLYVRKDNDQQFLKVSYPGYMSNGERHDYVEPLEEGTRWDREAKAEVPCNFKVLLEGAMEKQALAFHPELVEQLKGNLKGPFNNKEEEARQAAMGQGEQLKGNVDELIAAAQEEAAKQGAKGQAEPEKDALPL